MPPKKQLKKEPEPDAVSPLFWNDTDTVENYFFGVTARFENKTKVASFDLDGTLIDTKSGNVHPKDGDDWTWKYPNVVDTLKELDKNGYCLIIVSNQSGVGKRIEKRREWVRKLNNVVAAIGLQMTVLCSIATNKYRKPGTEFVDKFFPNTMVKSESFFCGDAVGREGDFSDTDYKFAVNAGIGFKTPEDLFLGKKVALPPIRYCIDFANRIGAGMSFRPAALKEMVIMCGFPGSGKSSVARLIDGYVVLNQDIMGTKEKVKKAALNEMAKGKSVIIDATNGSRDKRAEWIELAKGAGYSVRVILMTTTLEHSKHNNCYRAFVHGANLVPDIVYNIYAKNYEEPQLTEEIAEIIRQGPNYPNDEAYWRYYN